MTSLKVLKPIRVAVVEFIESLGKIKAEGSTIQDLAAPGCEHCGLIISLLGLAGAG